MRSRAEIIDDNFSQRVLSNELPSAGSSDSLSASGLAHHEVVDLFESQAMSRQLDLHSRRLQARGESFYTIGSAGHEGNAVCGKVFRHTDMAFLHYRSGALMIQRSKQCAGQTPLYDMLLSFAASSDDPISGGRHKVLGSKTLYVPPQTSTIASHLPKAVGAAFSIPLAASHRDQPNVDQFNAEQFNSELPHDSVVICNFGDASSNHSTAQGAINTAAWAAYQGTPLPLVLICEDNGIGISTRTPTGWIAANFSHRPGLAYLSCNGLDLVDSYVTMQQAAAIARHRRKPVFVHMQMVRLMGHAGSDAEIAYKTQAAIEQTEAQDPLLYTAGLVVNNGILTAQQIVDLYVSIGDRVKRIAEFAIKRPKLTTIEQVSASIAPHRSVIRPLPRLNPAAYDALFEKDKALINKPQPMGRLINWTLKELMAVQPNIVLCGEDIAAKGGVYHVTHGLLDSFGPSRVVNTLLDEQSILGLAIGMAHNGFMPIPEIQFLAYVHNAEDQIRGEAATLAFFSNGQFSNPMVLRIAGLGYQKGFGGHFHNDNSLAVFRDIPGIVIACPSNGEDAAAMLRSCVQYAWEQKRVVIFIEPIALYMAKDLHQEGDGQWSACFAANLAGDADALQIGTINSNAINDGEIAIGQIGIYQQERPDTQTAACANICIISYANGYFLSRQAAKILSDQYNIDVKLIDLRWLSDIDKAALIKEVTAFEHILIVDECRKTGSISETLLSLLLESKQIHQGKASSTKIARLTGVDCFVPLGKAATLGMPSREAIVQRTLALMNLSQHTANLAVRTNLIKVTP